VLFNDAVNCEDYTASVINAWLGMEHCWHEVLRERERDRERNKTYPNSSVPTINSRLVGLEWNPDLRGERSANGRCCSTLRRGRR
jgi:hypothetical protein